MELSGAVSDYLTACEAGGLSPATLAAYRYGLRRMCDSLGAVDLGAIGARELRAWLAAVQRLGLADSTVNQHYRSAHAFFTWCVSGGLLQADPMGGVRAPKVARGVPRYLSLTDMGRLIAAMAEGRRAVRDVAIGLLLLDCGLRRAELVALELASVDLAGLRLVVRRGKGGRGRAVPVSPAVVHALRCWLVVRPASAGRSLFGVSAAAVYLMVRRAAQRAGLDISPHGLRHTFATHYDGPLDDLQRILGHADVETTITIYRHRLDADLIREHAARSPLARMPSGRQLELGISGE